MLLPAGQRDVFQAEYGAAAGHPAGADLWARAKGWALAFSLVFLAHSADNAQLAGIGQRGLSAVLG